MKRLVARTLAVLACLASAGAAVAQRPTRRLEVTSTVRGAVPFDQLVTRLLDQGVGAAELPVASEAAPLESGVLVQVDARRFLVWDGVTDAVGLPARVASALAAHVAAGGAPRVIVAADRRAPAGRVLHAITSGRRAATDAGAFVTLLVSSQGGLGTWAVLPAPDGRVRAPADALRLQVEIGAAGGYRASANPLLATRWSISDSASAQTARGLERFLGSFREHDPDRKVAVLAVPGDARFAQLAELVGVVRRHYPIVVLAAAGRSIWLR